MKIIGKKYLKEPKGQSFLELALVMLVLPMIFVGVIETGLLINEYLDIIDAARESARNANTYEFWHIDYSTVPPTVEPGDLVYNQAAKVAWNTINPSCQGYLKDKDVELIPAPCNMRIPFDPLHDDIVISVLSYDGANLIRYPSGGWSRFNTGATSTVTNTAIMNELDPTSPHTGMILVEIFYNYHQLLGMPIFSDVVPDPIRVHTYAIMPYPSADPEFIPTP